MKYKVGVQLMVSALVEVEADSPNEAVELAFDSPDMPGSITIGAFGSANVDEAGDWEPYFVLDGDGTEVWWADQ